MRKKDYLCTLIMELIAQSGSNRQYFRDHLADGRTVIRVVGTSREENHAFITMARHFHALGLPVPEVYEVSSDEMEYTQEDLGSLSLFDYLQPARQSGVFSESDKQLLRRTLQALARIQVEGAKGMDWSVCYPVQSMNERSIFWDLNYFKYCYLKLTQIDFSEDLLENDFEALSSRILQEPQDYFLYRDCQSRNVMLREQDGQLQPYFIDFQGGRQGSRYYDYASFLWQAKANIPQALRNELFADTKLDRNTLDHFVLFRLLQVLGAYGYRGLFERKPHFVESLPIAINNLRELFTSCADLRAQYPYIYALSNRL